MKTPSVLALIGLALSASSAPALTVTPSEVSNKVREVSLSQVRFEGQPRVVLADAQGISLYTFDLDTEGKSVCRGRCLEVWPPLSVSEGLAPPAPFGTITGNNGKTQLTLKGLPLYYFHKDKAPGDTRGHYPEWQLIFVKE